MTPVHVAGSVFVIVHDNVIVHALVCCEPLAGEPLRVKDILFEVVGTTEVHTAFFYVLGHERGAVCPRACRGVMRAMVCNRSVAVL